METCIETTRYFFFFLVDFFFLDFFVRNKNFIKWQSYSLYSKSVLRWSIRSMKGNLLLIFIIIKIV